MYNEHGSRVEEGVAVLSKFPIRRQDYILLSRDYTDKQKASIERCAHTCPVHLSLHPETEQEFVFNWKK